MEHANTPLDVARVVKEFWEAPDEALFTQKTLALVADVSESYLERARWAGSGPRYLKLGGGRLVRYTKGDSVTWMIGSRPLASTSETLPRPAVSPRVRKKREKPPGNAKQKPRAKAKARLVGVTQPPA